MKDKINRIYIVQPGESLNEIVVDLEAVIGIGQVQVSGEHREFTVKLTAGELYVIRDMPNTDSSTVMMNVKNDLVKRWIDYHKQLKEENTNQQDPNHLNETLSEYTARMQKQYEDPTG